MTARGYLPRSELDRQILFLWQMHFMACPTALGSRKEHAGNVQIEYSVQGIGAQSASQGTDHMHH